MKFNNQLYTVALYRILAVIDTSTKIEGVGL